MKISVVTNAYNQGKFLPEALESVLAQDYGNIEYLVVDPGSTDNTQEVIREYCARFPNRTIRVINERDNGPADGLNKAFAMATGDIFTYLNADDLYLPASFRAAVSAMQEHPDAAAVYADGYVARVDGEISHRVLSTGFGPRRFVYGGCLVLQQSTFYRASAFRAVGGFNVANKTSWDAEILLDMSVQGMKLVHINDYWSVFRIHGESITGSQRLADESRRNHDRMFLNVMKRKKNRADRLVRHLVRLWTAIAEPRVTIAKLADRLRAPRVRVIGHE